MLPSHIWVILPGGAPQSEGGTVGGGGGGATDPYLGTPMPGNAIAGAAIPVGSWDWAGCPPGASEKT